jgi:putative SOS response-associated peptidase YedK
VCGRYSNSLGPEQLARQVGDPLGVEGAEGVEGVEVRERGQVVSYNIAPTDPVVAVVAPQGKPEARVLRWGLSPAWIKGSSRPHINARIEGIRSTGKFLGVAPGAEHRALIVATEFIEWAKAEQPGKSKPVPFGFSLADDRPFCFAGLWIGGEQAAGGEEAADGTSGSCTIITCDARGNSLVAPLHDRMPAMLADPDEWKAWLDPGLSAQDALELCGPLPTELMKARPLPVSFNDSRIKQPEELFSASGS